MHSANTATSDLQELRNRYAELKSRGLKLDLTRGKPGAEQVSISDRLDGILNQEFKASDGTDTRNYGGLRGLPEARELGAELLGVDASRVMAGGNSSLQLMFLAVQTAVHAGLAGPPLRELGRSRAVCPVPGYDRHFSIMEWFGIAMIAVDMGECGPDMEATEKFVQADPAVRFVWCVPKYSNPTGCTYSSETVRRLAKLPRLREDLDASPCYVFWDNAYAVHGFGGEDPELDCIYAHAESEGTQDRVVLFASTSKMTHAGSGVAFAGGSDAVLNSLQKSLAVQTVGPDKVNQLRHARLLGGRIREHMARHARVLAPKFNVVQEGLDRHLGGLNIASWTKPRGGYFVSLDVPDGCAKATVRLAGEAGLALTPAGATFPYGVDPRDRNIRIAPTFARPNDLPIAVELLSVCVRLAWADRAAND
ncbi:MAG: aminotransferase class I/II-fold pyridoxal phosphate-dependent enzyme [Pseudomonadales bacterium]|nr:aminotransferase class I/II-fold pyridoxal phosphate-dependent enzyme [Pseudomonadales bacterium]